MRALVIGFLAATLVLGYTAAGQAVNVARMIEYKIPTPNAQASFLTLGPDGNIWFTELRSPKIGRVTPQGVITEFQFLRHGAGYAGIAYGPNGDFWINWVGCVNLGSCVLEVTPSGHLLHDYRIAYSQNDIIAGPDGNLWIDMNDNFSVVRLEPNGNSHRFPVSEGQTNSLTVGPDGNIWFAENNSMRNDSLIGRMTTAGVLTEFKPPVPLANVGQVAGAPDGSMYFNDVVSGNSGKLDPATGKITMISTAFLACFVDSPPKYLWLCLGLKNPPEELALRNVYTGKMSDRFQFPSSAYAYPMIRGSDGNIWFADPQNNAIGVVIIH
jgi:streptogramin lyase